MAVAANTGYRGRSETARPPSASRAFELLIAGYGGAARRPRPSRSLTLRPKSSSPAATCLRAIARPRRRWPRVTLKEAAQSHYDALIHATPLGMFPRPDECLFADRLPAAIVFTWSTTRHETLLLKRAKQQGCTVIPGLEMLLEQAAHQFEIWTGETAPRSVMRASLDASIMCA